MHLCVCVCPCVCAAVYACECVKRCVRQWINGVVVCVCLCVCVCVYACVCVWVKQCALSMKRQYGVYSLNADTSTQQSTLGLGLKICKDIVYEWDVELMLYLFALCYFNVKFII